MGEPTVGYILFEDALKFTGDYPEDRHPAQFSVIHIRREVFIPKPVSLTEKMLRQFYSRCDSHGKHGRCPCRLKGSPTIRRVLY